MITYVLAHRPGERLHLDGPDPRVPCRKRVPATSYEGMTSVPDGYKTGDVEIVLDVEALARRLGWQAISNKTGKATLARGAIKVTAKNIRRFAEGS